MLETNSTDNTAEDVFSNHSRRPGEPVSEGYAVVFGGGYVPDDTFRRADRVLDRQLDEVRHLATLLADGLLQGRETANAGWLKEYRRARAEETYARGVFHQAADRARAERAAAKASA